MNNGVETWPFYLQPEFHICQWKRLQKTYVASKVLAGKLSDLSILPRKRQNVMVGEERARCSEFMNKKGKGCAQ